MLDRPEWMFAGSLAELLPGNVTLDEHHDMLLFPGVVVGRYLCGVRDLLEWTAGIAYMRTGTYVPLSPKLTCIPSGNPCSGWGGFGRLLC